MQQSPVGGVTKRVVRIDFGSLRISCRSRFKPIREFLYNYHRKGLDKLYINQAEAITAMSAAIDALNDVHRIKPSSYNMQVLFYAKSDEIVNIYKPRAIDEKKAVTEMCKLLDPGNISKYEKIMQ